MLYFAYGSNMDKPDLDKWCSIHNYPPVKILSTEVAILRDYELLFNYNSHTREGGAANIMKNEGSSVYGLLLDVNDDALDVLREKEGYPYCYEELLVEVENADKSIITDVLTYEVVPEKRDSEHIPPTQQYMKLLIRNAKKYGFPGEYIECLEQCEVI